MKDNSINNGARVWRVVAWVFLFLSIPVWAKAVAQEDSEELIEGPYKSEFLFDFDGDGKPEIFTIDWKIVKDYGTYPWLGTRSAEKYIWYQARLRIRSHAGRVYHDDIFSMMEDDFSKMAALVGRDNMTPYYYFWRFFSIPEYESKLNEVMSSSISREEIDTKHLADLVRSEKPDVSVEAVIEELTQGVHIVVLYRRDWHEDLGIIVYSRLLDRSVFLKSPYDG